MNQCPNCGFMNPYVQAYCPHCGMPMPVQQDDATGPILNILQSNLFMAICILLSVVCVMNITMASIPLIEILLAVFLWLVYSRACKGYADADQLRNVSGTVYAQYVITYVSAILIAVMGLICTLVISVVLQDSNLINQALAEAIQDEALLENIRQILSVVGAIPAFVYTLIFVLVGAAIILFNIFSLRYIHRFAKSVYRSLQSRRLELEHANAARIWLFIYGGISIVSAILVLTSGQLIPMLVNGCNAAACIIAGVLIGKLTAPAPSAPAPMELHQL